MRFFAFAQNDKKAGGNDKKAGGNDKQKGKTPPVIPAKAGIQEKEKSKL